MIMAKVAKKSKRNRGSQKIKFSIVGLGVGGILGGVPGAVAGGTLGFVVGKKKQR